MDRRGQPLDNDLDAFRFLKTLRRGEEVVVRTGGEDVVMFVSRAIDTAHELLWTPWELSNVHLLKDFGGATISITVAQQLAKGDPHIVSRSGTVRAVEIGSDVYKRLDELSDRYENTKAMTRAVKNMLAKRAEEMVKL